eukprot:CAMPEP_0198570338 /NCGR_PEP_ID=MMETSP1462-20131121/108975_1 /TAXON_ID=1333877 /ORGANISM="Brandtodinium nutriculum, Strain RCC3387" /LENGTH=253 /DNA_ID=CAMNT_0044301453 /DNA_START=23 /DNA_END=780 /DNA_ORIENTATION=+
MAFPSLCNELASLLYWSMLAACTVGPGTVVTCARAGVEYNLQLIWPLVFASVLAYALQESTVRLTIVSGRSLGQCLREKCGGYSKLCGAAIPCWLVSGAVVVGNTMYECNNWAGGVDAVFALPGVVGPEGEDRSLIRVGSCLGYAATVILILAWDQTDALGVCLGVVMVAMIGLFAVVVALMGFSWSAFLLGLVPGIPNRSSAVAAEPADLVLSLVGTTAIGFNLFLGGSMAVGRQLGAARRGIAFSTLSAML